LRPRGRHRRPQRRGARHRRQGAELFGEPRRIIDKDEAIELLTAALPDLDEAEARTRLSSRQGFCLAEARDHAEAAAGHPQAPGIPGIGFLRENKRVYPTGAASRI